MKKPEEKYKARFHHFGAMINEMRILNERFDPNEPINDWVSQLVKENVVGKPSRTWTKELIIGVFLQRFVNGKPPNVWKVIQLLESKKIDISIIKLIIYYHTAIILLRKFFFINIIMLVWSIIF